MTKKFYIKQRSNPQIGVYYVPLGQLSQREVFKQKGSIYGSNRILKYDTKEEYDAAIAQLKLDGARVN